MGQKKNDYYSDSSDSDSFDDDEEPRIPTPESLKERKIRRKKKYNFAYLTTSSAKVKYVEIFFNLIVLISVAFSGFLIFIRSQLLLIISLLAVILSAVTLLVYVLRIVDKYPHIEWKKWELLLNTLVAFLYLVSVPLHSALMNEVTRSFKKVDVAGALSMICYVYDASLYFISDDDPLRENEVLKEKMIV